MFLLVLAYLGCPGQTAVKLLLLLLLLIYLCDIPIMIVGYFAYSSCIMYFSRIRQSQIGLRGRVHALVVH